MQEIVVKNVILVKKGENIPTKNQNRISTAGKQLILTRGGSTAVKRHVCAFELEQADFLVYSSGIAGERTFEKAERSSLKKTQESHFLLAGFAAIGMFTQREVE